MIVKFENPQRGDYTSGMFEKITNNISVPFDAFFMHSTMVPRYLQNLKFTESLVILAVDDNPEFVPEYNYWTKSPAPEIFPLFDQLAQNNPDKTFILLLPGNYWTKENFQSTNIRVANWHVIQENDTYPGILPVEKNFDSTKIGITFNRQMRIHRIALISLLYGQGLDQYCHITAHHLYKQLEKNPSDDFLMHNDWRFDPEQDSTRDQILSGFKKVVNLYSSKQRFQQEEDAYPLYPGSQAVVTFDNCSNFEKRLRPYYQNSFVEFIGCRLYSEPTVSIDEKYINSICARNFPVIIGSTGTVAFYRESGLDLFDDIVDHSYDLIENPISRLAKAIELNRHLLVDFDNTKQKWKQCEERFNDNLKISHKQMYNYYENKSLRSCNNEILDFLKEPFNA